MVFLAMRITTRKAELRRGESSGSTSDQMLANFSKKMYFFALALVVYDGNILYNIINWLFLKPPYALAPIGKHIMDMRGIFAGGHAVGIELLYFGFVERILRCFRRCKSSPPPTRETENPNEIENVALIPRPSVKQTTFPNDRSQRFSYENPLRQSNQV